MRLLLRAFLVTSVMALMLCAILSLSAHRTDPRFSPSQAEWNVSTAPVGHESSAVSDDDRAAGDGDSSIDLYGNDVTDAVAKYSLDATGSLYEVHSPQTEIPRLASPKS